MNIISVCNSRSKSCFPRVASHNSESIRRLLDSGADGVIIPKDRAVGVTPTVIKVAAGGAAIVPVVRVTNLARSMRQLKERGVWLYGTSEYAGEGVASADVRLPVAWVMGNERKGLSRTVMQECDALYSIETSGFSTLNIATSTGICLYYTHLNRL